MIESLGGWPIGDPTAPTHVREAQNRYIEHWRKIALGELPITDCDISMAMASLMNFGYAVEIEKRSSMRNS